MRDVMRPKVLGILNVTPDSFSDGGDFLRVDDALRRADEMIAEGVDMIDVGGESTRPGAIPVPPEVEIERVGPVIEALAGRCPVSIDTRHEVVARAAVEAGATMINDVSASLAHVAADTGVAWVAMHMLGAPGTMQDNPTYDDVVAEVTQFLVDRADHARQLGVDDVWIDPGFGFGKTLQHNLDLLAGLGQLVATGYPVLVGTSRKSMLGALLAQSDAASPQSGAGSTHSATGADAAGSGGVSRGTAALSPVPPADRLVGSVATATYALALGAKMIRVHDVKETVQAVTVVHGPRPEAAESLGFAASSTLTNRESDVEGQA